MEKITAVVVTYCRLQLVKKTINALRNQLYKLDSIIVIDNNSIDGTSEWLDSQNDLVVIHQENVGGSGGFYRGIKEAYDRGADWIWCMDDDVYPRQDCLKNLLNSDDDKVGILCPRRVINNQPFVGECMKLNFSSFLKSFHEKETPLNLYEQDKPFSIMGMAFEGPLIKRNVVSKIGLPNKDLFILFDDTEYSYRAIINGFPVYLVPTAVLDKEDFIQKSDKKQQVKKSVWKLYYEIRNNSYMHHTYGTTFSIRVIKPLFLLIRYDIIFLKNLFNDKYKFSDFISWHRAYLDGQKSKLGRK